MQRYDTMTEGDLMTRAGQGDATAKRIWTERVEARRADFEAWQTRNPGRPAAAYGLGQ